MKQVLLITVITTFGFPLHASDYVSSQGQEKREEKAEVVRITFLPDGNHEVHGKNHRWPVYPCLDYASESDKQTAAAVRITFLPNGKREVQRENNE